MTPGASTGSRETSLHGHRVSYREAGDGPVLVLLHGIAGSSETWDAVIPALADQHTVVAPDLLGHGASAKPRGDYSLGAYASGLRDLLSVLGHDRVSVVGHSLGGGVAMQFAYQFPERIERLGLVSSGGLGREVSILLRSATFPGSEWVLPLLASGRLRHAGNAVARLAGRIGLRAGGDAAELWRSFETLGDAQTREAFIHTVRAIIDHGGQRVSAHDRLYLAGHVPTLIVWGERDRIIPVAHGRATHELIPDSRLEVIPNAGHFPHRDAPARFAGVLTDFLWSTDPAEMTEAVWRDRLRGWA